MSLWMIAWRSIQQRSLASALTALSMALGVMLVVAVLVIKTVVTDSFERNSSLGYNVIVGAKGSPLQLVLNTVFHLSRPIENIPWSYYKEFRDGQFKGYAAQAIPVCMGDFYGEFRVVGVPSEMFNDYTYDYNTGSKYEFAEGRNFDPAHYFEGVIGSAVARSTGLKIGDTFQPSHGAEDGHVHDPFTVVGILAPTGTPSDRALFINIEGFYLLDDHAKPETPKPPPAGAPPVAAADAHDHAHDHEGHDHDHAHEPAPAATATTAAAAPKQAATHDHAHDDHDHAHDHAHGHDHGHHHHHDPLPESQREVTAILVRTTNDLVTPALVNTINEGQVAQAVLPVREITSLFSLFVDPLQMVLLALTVLIVVVAGISILVSIYNSMSERRHEIAVMRALGASRRTVMNVVLLESILLSLGGGLAGWLLGHILFAAFSPVITAYTGVVAPAFQVDVKELILIPGLIVLASLVGYLPALAAYRTDVGKALSETP
jgi:putative ABC transport system permease protein